MDVIAMHQAGFTNAVASLGTAFTAQQALLLKRYTKQAILTYDSDGAGIKAALRAIPILKDGEISVKVSGYAAFIKDPDEFMKNLEETIEKLNKYGQTHIVKIMEKLTEEEKEKLSDQIQKLDFENIKNLYNELTKEEVNVGKKMPTQSQI